ncbi:PREDICTED: carcinoembryonic antigen-related cell adhesion molecule 19 [Condylura cristata]|uniref:carcinoembryonic antigen-related cell adhesion molecule 19 n=1 Tax=Condylura cristata TaxID=143302 RepID=UPI0006439B4C|nr:PREDICTED: carcinoembryonic antigen-related cell adhesion molecule 19 [Condylura cristata]
MELPCGDQGRLLKSLLLSASILTFWIAQSSGEALHIQKIPEHPQKNQDLLLSVHGIPEIFQVCNWYLGEEISGSTMLFSYFPELQRPQREGSAIKHRDIVGFPNGSMLLRHAQPNDSGIYQITVTMNPDWTMRTKTQVQVVDSLEKHKESAVGRLPESVGVMAAIVIGALATGSLLIGGVTYLLVIRGCKGQNHRVSAPGGQKSMSVLFPAVTPVPSAVPSPWTTAAEKPELGPSHNAGDDIVYEVMPSPVLLVSPFSDLGAMNTAMPPALPLPLQPEPQNQHYQDLLNPDPAPYCQLVPTPEGVPEPLTSQETTCLQKNTRDPGGLGL